MQKERERQARTAVESATALTLVCESPSRCRETRRESSSEMEVGVEEPFAASSSCCHCLYLLLALITARLPSSGLHDLPCFLTRYRRPFWPECWQRRQTTNAMLILHLELSKGCS